MQRVSLQLNKEQIDVIRAAHEVVGQTDDQIASAVVVSYIERSLAKPHLDICSWAYVSPIDSDDQVRLNLTMTEGQWRRLDNICATKRMGRAIFIRWIIADTAVKVGYPR